MLKRIITSLVAICILLPILFLSDTFIFPIAVALLTCTALYEMYKCIGKEKNYYASLPTYLFAIVSPFIIRYVGNSTVYISFAFISSAAYLLFLFTVSVFQKGKTKLSDVGELFTVSIYIIAAFNSILYIRDIENSGKYLYLLVFIGAWITDIFAYFTGMLLGKHKLIPEVSPKKTVEGSIGGTLFCILSFVCYGIVVGLLFHMEANIIFLAVSGAIVSVIAQIGDLIMSLIKREYGIKDYGKILPGHGGVLDRFDSILAVSLALCAICIFANITGIALI